MSTRILKNFSGLFIATFIIFLSGTLSVNAQTVSTSSVTGLPDCIYTGAYSLPCGDVITAAQASFAGGSFRGNAVAAGDILQCNSGGFNSQPVCSVTHPTNNTNTVSQETQLGALHATTTDQNGTITATTSQSTTDRLAAGLPSVGSTCSITNWNFSDCLLNGIAIFIFGIANTLLALAGVVLNFVVLRTIFQFSTLIGNSPGLLIGWGLLRDISNMLLLFGFVYIGISTILGLSTYTVKKTLPHLLIFAVLLNFSLFAAEGVIDVSNLFSSVMYSQANTGTCQSTTSLSASTNTDANCAVNYGVAGHIMQSTGLSSVFASNAAGTGPQEAATLVGLAIFAVIGTVVIIAMAIMFAIRAIVLTFVMVTAPIGFAGMAIPQLNKLATRWWDALIKQSFFAPVMLLLIFVSLKVTDSFGRNGSLGASLANSNVDTISVIFVFVIVCGFLLASLKIASDMGAVGSKFAISTAKKIGYGVPRAAGSVLGRNTIGRASAAAQKKYDGSSFARRINKVPIIGSSVDIGISKAAGSARKSKFGGTTSFDERVARDKAREKALGTAKNEKDTEVRKAALKKELGDALDAPITATHTDEDKNDAVSTVLQKMSSTEIQELDQMKTAGEKLDLIAKNVSAEKFAAIMKDGNNALTDAQKKDAREARFKKASEDIVTLADPTRTPEHAEARKRLRQYSAKDLENAPPELLNNDTTLENISESQRADLVKNGNMSPVVDRKLRANDPLEKVRSSFASAERSGLPADYTSVAKLIKDTTVRPIKSMKPANVAKLSGNILSRPEVAEVLDVPMLNAINANGESDLTDAQRDIISQVLADRATRPVRPDPKILKYIEGPGKDTWGI